MMRKAWLIAGLAGLCGAALGQVPQYSKLGAKIAAMVAEPGVSRAHWGVMVTGLDGTPIFAMNEGQLFQPASNVKLFTTAAALGLLHGQTFETRVLGSGHFDGAEALTGDLVLKGDGDANLSGRAVPYVAASANKMAGPPLRYLEEIADAVAKTGLKTVHGDVVGDDGLFPWEPYGIDWAADDLVWGYGAPVSALTVNDNKIKLTVRPGAVVGAPGVITLEPAVAYYTMDVSELVTGAAKSGSRVEIERGLGSKVVRVYGLIAVDAKPDEEEIAIADPAEFAAVALKEMLVARGVEVTGVARAAHRLPVDSKPFLAETKEPIIDITNPVTALRLHGDLKNVALLCKGCEGSLPPKPGDPMERTLAAHLSPSVDEDVVVTNKESQNLHAELLLHQLGAAVGSDGSAAQGARVVRQFAVNAGVDPNDFVFYDGSGMSGHDLVTPRAIVKLLQFASTQPWFATYKASLPVGGVDGTLQNRFAVAPLRGHVFAKTGTNSESRALSGYVECASGRTVVFSVLVGEHIPGSSADRDVMDRIVAAIAAAN